MFCLLSRKQGFLQSNLKKLPAAILQRGTEAGVYRKKKDFHGFGVNHINSWLFLQSPFSRRYKLPKCLLLFESEQCLIE